MKTFSRHFRRLCDRDDDDDDNYNDDADESDDDYDTHREVTVPVLVNNNRSKPTTQLLPTDTMVQSKPILQTD